ncbi:MAG: hypothetical protein MH252_14230 [Thermosynechococcaceae cyanobacterium MS004]|nr:hypothetical protein [Thermosynechococcaceae cyanobacterium MS004]
MTLWVIASLTVPVSQTVIPVVSSVTEANPVLKKACLSRGKAYLPSFSHSKAITLGLILLNSPIL